VVADWSGAPLRRIVLIGHSMGGLVATRALQLAADDSTWTALVTDVVTLGSPLAGAPLERFSDSTLNAVIKASEAAAPIAELGHYRAVGIKDLGDGVRDPLPEHVRHLAVVAAVGSTPSAPTSRIIGDGIVPTESARGRHHEHPQVTVVELVRAHHLSLLNHPGVTELLTELVARD
jgi:pimeloyl-ACP methyl ester carboxylesterase